MLNLITRRNSGYLGCRSPLIDRPKLTQMVITMLEMRSLPLFSPERSEKWMYVYRLRHGSKMVEKVKNFLL